MPRIVTPAQKVASALKGAETTLRNWQDDPNSPRGDVDKMLHTIADLRAWVAGHVLAEIERAHTIRNPSSPVTYHTAEALIAELPEPYDHHPRQTE